MKRFITILAIAAIGFAATPSIANSWQWQLDLIKADQQRRAKHAAEDQAHLEKEKMSATPKKAVEQGAKPVPAPTVK